MQGMAIEKFIFIFSNLFYNLKYIKLKINKVYCIKNFIQI